AKPRSARQFVLPAARNGAICSRRCVRRRDPADRRVSRLGLLHARKPGPAAPVLFAPVARHRDGDAARALPGVRAHVPGVAAAWRAGGRARVLTRTRWTTSN